MIKDVGFRRFGAAFRSFPQATFRGFFVPSIVVVPSAIYVDVSLPDFVLQVRGRDGSLVAPLTNAVVTEVEWELDKEGKLDFELPKTDPVLSQIVVGLHEAQLWWKGVPLFTGPIWQAERSPTTIKFGCQGLLSYFKKRFILRASLIYTSVEQTSIANALVLAAQTGEANMGLNIDTAGSVGGSTHIRSRRYDRNKHQMFYDLLQEFPGIRDGFDFEIVIDPTGMQRAFTCFYPSKGSELRNIGLEWGRNIVDYTIKDDAFVMANEVYATGGSNAGVKFENNYEDTASAAFYGVMQRIVSDGQQNDVGWLLDLAHRWVEIGKVPSRTADVTAVEVPQSLLGEVSTGDLVRVLIDDYSTQVDGIQRIESIKWSPVDGKLVFGFSAPAVLT